MVTLKDDDPASGAEIVIQTREVGYDEYTKGLVFATGLYLLHDCRGLYMTMQLLHALRWARFQDVIDAFVTWMGKAAGNGIVDLWRDGENHFEQTSKYVWRGAIAYAALHRHRQDMDKLLKSFVGERLECIAEAQGGRADLVHAAVEFDLLNRPYLYVQTPLQVGVELERLQIREQRRGVWMVESPFDFPAMVGALRTRGEMSARDWQRGKFEVTIDHRPGQAFHPSTKSEGELYWHCDRLIGAIRQTEAQYQTRNLERVMVTDAGEINRPGSVGSV